MSKRDDEDEEATPIQPPALVIRWLRKIAAAVYNLSLGLDAAAKAHKARHESAEAAARARHDELVGLVLATSDPNRKKRHPTPEHTDKFKLPEGVQMEVPRATTKKWVERVGKVAFWVAIALLSHAARCLAEHQIELAKRPTEKAPIAAPAER